MVETFWKRTIWNFTVKSRSIRQNESKIKVIINEQPERLHGINRVILTLLKFLMTFLQWSLLFTALVIINSSRSTYNFYNVLEKIERYTKEQDIPNVNLLKQILCSTLFKISEKFVFKTFSVDSKFEKEMYKYGLTILQ